MSYEDTYHMRRRIHVEQYLSHTETHHSVQCLHLHQTGVDARCPEKTLDGNW